MIIKKKKKGKFLLVNNVFGCDLGLVSWVCALLTVLNINHRARTSDTGTLSVSKPCRDFRLNRHLVLNNIKQLLFSWSCCVPTWRMWLLMSVCVWVVSRDVQQSSVCVYISCVCWPGWQSYYCLTPEGVSCQCGQALSYPKALNELAPTTKQRGLEMLCL